MKRSFRLAFLVLAALSILPAVARAGYSAAPAINCWRNADGSGGCQGTLRGFKANADPLAYGGFISYFNTASWSFFGRLGSVYYSCSSAGPVHAPITGDTYFAVTWDATGKCTSQWSNPVSYYLP